MRIKHHFSLLVLILLAGLIAGVAVSSVSAQSDEARIIQISPTGQGRALAVAYSPDGRSLAVGSSLGINFYNSSDLHPIRFTPTDTWVRALAFSPDSRLLVTGSYDNIIRIWRSSDGTLVKQLRGHTSWVRTLAFSSDGETLATASDDNTVHLWSIPTGDLLHTFDQGTEGIRTLAFSPNGDILATGGFDNIVRLWQVPDGNLLRELKGHTGWIRTLAFSPNGEFLASGAFDATVRLWRVLDGKLLVTRTEHSSSVLGLAFSPDGELLASASVDTSVRLWKMPTLELYGLLRGHTDFVYSVAFSPDGKSLVSGAADNTVRVWNVPEEADLAAQERVLSPSNCKACHHPQGLQGPPRVVETDCSVCHGNGALVLNWCLAFPRSSGSTTMSVQLQSDESAGLYHPTTSSNVIIYAPGNGEVVYGRTSISYPLLVAGKAQYQGNSSDIKLILEIQAENGPSIYVESFPLPDGSFSFVLKGNHGSARPVLLGHSTFARQALCLSCHTGYSDANLPDKGAVRLRVTMVDSDGVQSWDERDIYVDSGGTAVIPVKVLVDGNPSIVNLPIHAVTRLYEWRERTFTATIDSQGEANLQVEALSQNPTTYRISVPPTVINGVLYTSKDNVQVTLLPGATTAPTVTLHVQAAGGEISGRVASLDIPVQVWAVSLPDGSAIVASTSSQGAFSFTNLKAGKYLLLADPQALAEQGLALAAESIDLSQAPSAQIDLKPQLLEGASLTGNIMAEDGTPLPFAWVNVAAQTGQTDPASGAYAFFGLPDEKATALLSAPGYYSQAHYINIPAAAVSSMSFSLVRRPETMLLPWGDGTIVVPPETVAHVEGQKISFEQGWLWGKGEAGQALVIQWEDMQITIPSGQFALERLPARSGWLYLMHGQASIQRGSTTGPVTVQAGEMVLLSREQEPHPVHYDPVVVGTLRLSGEVPVQPAWQPSLEAQIRDRLAQAGISVAQFATFATYLLAFLFLLVMPVLAASRSLKNRRKRRT